MMGWKKKNNQRLNYSQNKNKTMTHEKLVVVKEKVQMPLGVKIIKPKVTWQTIHPSWRK